MDDSRRHSAAEHIGTSRALLRRRPYEVQSKFKVDPSYQCPAFEHIRILRRMQGVSTPVPTPMLPDTPSKAGARNI
jgi:hypothetical protein